MSDEATMGTESSPSQWTGLGTQQQDPLVAVTFQKNTNRKQKFLEAEPKALGITQIGLCVYQISWLGVYHIPQSHKDFLVFYFFFLNVPVIIAGSLTIAAQNLHLPTDSYTHLYAGFILIQAVLLAISITLAAYCCKVVNCCSPASKMPVITVQASPAQQ